MSKQTDDVIDRIRTVWWKNFRVGGSRSGGLGETLPGNGEEALRQDALRSEPEARGGKNGVAESGWKVECVGRGRGR